MKLDRLDNGDFAKVQWVGGWGPIRSRLLDMGFVKGEIVEVIRRAPINGPIEVSVKGAFLSLRPEEAQWIDVFPLSNHMHHRHFRGHHGVGGRHRFFHRLFGFQNENSDEVE
ncbi:ferrous iron transport protein A [bacterium]|nr:ferrous iron transport protein A [bacterium]